MTVPGGFKTWTDGTAPTATEFNEELRDDLGFFLNPPRLHVRHQTLEAVTATYGNDADKYIPWSVQDEVHLIDHSTSTATDALGRVEASKVVITVPGTYDISVNCEVGSSTVSQLGEFFGVMIYKETVASKVRSTLSYGRYEISDRLYQFGNPVNWVGPLAVDDVIRINVYCENGATAANTGNVFPSNVLRMKWVAQ